MKLPKTYDPTKHEDTVYKLWVDHHAFAPVHRGNDAYFSLVVPPPNANGDLHIGHALTLALEDIAIRYHRLTGKASLLLPGADHAGFETQVVYEKQLAKEGKSRFDFSREDLYRQIWDFVAQNRTNFETQLRRLGGSVDWDRFTFTLDEKIVKRAYATFQKMWDQGLVYRGERLVNFCTFHGTGFADIEVEYKEVEGKLWFIRYPLTEGDGEVIVATTRPETMLGDTAVAVNPSDKRYKQFIGKTVRLPLTNREIPVIADDMVDTSFGTGAVKITPAHDPNDYEVAERHDLPMISIIDHEGKMTNHAGETYRGLTVVEARQRIAKDLTEQHYLTEVKPHTHSVGHCYKCGTVIEPLLKEQWFVDMKPLAQAAIKELRAGKITFYPVAKREQLIHYLEGLKDWNISRQIAWGIPIPAFQNTDNPDDWIFDERVDKEELVIDGHTYRRDPDVFDTWFSSSSWPYATLNYPEGEDYKQFYPLSLMETGGEILYPWVSRMIMMGLYVTGNVPFEAVYIHGYVMAEDGSKMSKSIGNVIDPIKVINDYGSDALRMGIVAGRVAGVNRGYDPRKVQDARNFCNKLWNIARFIESKTSDTIPPEKPKPETTADHWILSKLQHITAVVSVDLDEYRFGEAYEKLYHFVWDDFADWYIEASKFQPNLSVLRYALETTLTLMHPFAPFVTETIWQLLGWQNQPLIVSPWPSSVPSDQHLAAQFGTIQSLIKESRRVIKAMDLNKPVLLHDSPLIDAYEEIAMRLGSLSKVRKTSQGRGLRLSTEGFSAWLEVEPAKVKAYAKKLQTDREGQTTLIRRLEERLANHHYTQNAPPQLVQDTKDQLAAAKLLADKIELELTQINKY